MARRVKDARLDTKAARAKLELRQEPHWRLITEGRHLGYYKGARVGTWIARFRPPTGGAYHKHQLGKADDTEDADGVTVLDFTQAQEKARAWFAGQIGPVVASAGPITVASAAARYVGYMLATKSRKQAKDTLRRLRRHLPASLRRRPVAAVTKTELESWLWGLARRDDGDREAERKSKDTANRVLTMLKAALNRAFNDDANGIPTDKAWRTVKPFKDVGRSRVLTLDAAQRQRLINTTTGAIRNLVIATLLTGSRPAPGELAQARVRDFHADIGVVSIRGKTGERSVPLTNEGLRFFRSLTAGRHPDALLLPKDDGSPWGYNHQLRPMRAAAKRANLPKGASMYTLRHTFATEHLMRGTDLKSLADIMGTSIAMLQKHYGHILASHKRKLIEAAGFKLGLKSAKVTPLRARA